GWTCAPAGRLAPGRRGLAGRIPMNDLIAGGPAERHLDDLFDRLAGTGGAGRRLLAGGEGPLRTATEGAGAGGLDGQAAEEAAVGRFGTPASIAAQLRVAHSGLGALVRPLIAGAFTVGVVGMLAVGVSGLLSELSGRAFGAAFVAGDASG